jgi:hypothetical protein
MTKNKIDVINEKYKGNLNISLKVFAGENIDLYAGLHFLYKNGRETHHINGCAYDVPCRKIIKEPQNELDKQIDGVEVAYFEGMNENFRQLSLLYLRKHKIKEFLYEGLRPTYEDILSVEKEFIKNNKQIEKEKRKNKKILENLVK